MTIQGAESGIAKLEALGRSTDLAGKKLALLGVGGALVAAAGMAALIVKTSEMAGDFQRGVIRLQTGAGDVQDSFTTLGNYIKQVAVDSGVSTGPLLQAMYLILSSGQRGTQAYNTLSVAAKGAQIEQAKVKDVANVLSGVMTNYGTKVFNATAYMNGLIKAVSLGKITLQDLSVAMGPIDPIARHLGVSFSDMAAAMTTQTNAMIPAHIAATGLRFLMQGLENPTKKAMDAMKAMGLNSIAVAEEMKRSLPGALQMIYDAALKAGPAGSVPFNRALADMVGGIRGTTAFMALTGPHMKDFAANAAAIAASMKTGSKEVTGWQLAQSGFNIQMDKAKAAMEVLGITIGQALLPALTKIVTAVTPIIVAVTNWLVKNNLILPILGAMAAIIGGILVASLISLVAASWPVIAVIAGIIAAIGLVIFVIQHWGQIVTWMGNLWHTVVNWMGNVWKTVSTTIGSWFSWLGSKVHIFITAWQIEFSYIGAQFSAFGSLVHGVISAIGGFFDGLGTKVHGFVTGVIAWFQQLPGRLLQIGRDMIQGLANGVYSMAGALASAIGTTVHNAVGSIPGLGGLLQATHLFGYQEGGPVLQTGLAMVHKGEYVIPAGGFSASRMPSSYGYGAGTAQPIVLQINGYTLARLLMPSIVQNIRNNVGITNL